MNQTVCNNPEMGKEEALFQTGDAFNELMGMDGQEGPKAYQEELELDPQQFVTIVNYIETHRTYSAIDPTYSVIRGVFKLGVLAGRKAERERERANHAG